MVPEDRLAAVHPPLGVIMSYPSHYLGKNITVQCRVCGAVVQILMILEPEWIPAPDPQDGSPSGYVRGWLGCFHLARLWRRG